jgi:HipA-like C-terminal domain
VERFPIIDVHLSDNGVGSGFVVDVEDAEQMGSKEKFWCKRVDTDERFLLKYPRPETGEDWAEKIAAELAGGAGLRLPHARVELAKFKDRPAVLVKDFLGDGERLIHGNELLLERDPEYPAEMHRVRQHTLANVFEVLEAQRVTVPRGFDLPDGVRTVADLYSGHLVLDALIGNTDRHHENWGIVVRREPAGERLLTLAPTYDHGSSLGRELRGEECESG